MKVQLLDLTEQYKKLRSEVLDEIKKVCDSQHYILGKNVSALESEIAAYCGVRHAVGVASGTDAILIALMAVGVKCCDYVITTPFTFFASAGSIARLGAIPLFVDIDPITYNIDVDMLEALLKKAAKTKMGKLIKAVLPIHLYGQCADMAPILAMGRKYKIAVIEDAAQSIGAEYMGKRAGSIGDMGCLSFYPTKNLGAFGDAGMITTDSEKLAERARMLRVHGSRARYYHDEIGLNSRLDEIQAAIIRVKLRYLDSWARKRIQNANRYDDLFERAELSDFVVTPQIQDRNCSVYNQYVVRVKDRDELRAHLASAGVGAEIYYPLPLHMQKCFKYLDYKRGDLPVSEQACKEVLALPIYPELKSAQQKYVVNTIAAFYANGQGRKTRK